MKKSLKFLVLTHLFKLNMHTPPADRGREVICVIKIVKMWVKKEEFFIWKVNL